MTRPGASSPTNVQVAARLRLMPTRTWIDGKAEVLMEELAASGMYLGRETAAGMIKDRVAVVAEQAGITELTARRYFGDEDVRAIARELLFEFVDEQPGADVTQLPRTVLLPFESLGRTFSALAEALQIRAANESGDSLVHTVGMGSQIISALGLILAEEAARQTQTGKSVAFPQALLRRAARFIRAAGHQLAGGGDVPADVPEDHRSALVEALKRDAEALTARAKDG